MATLPNARLAVVDPRKIEAYLLSRQHLDGAAKAAFFESFGFSTSTWEVLADALRDHAATNSVQSVYQTPFGEIFEVNGRLPSPDGRNPVVLVVWIITNSEDYPRLVTAVPSEEGP